MKKSIPQTYNPSEFEKHWLSEWEKIGLFQSTTKELSEKEKLYLLFAFAYPSGSGLHVGHVESMTALDILARYNRMRGKQVFFPVGWDAFGLPAENYAIKTGVAPAITTKQAIATFHEQIKRLAISYDWSSEIATCHPGYYKWTQWLFLQLHKQSLAYQGTGAVNWCPSCQTVLANEQVVEGACERCGTAVVQKQMKQWYFKITNYQDELISGLEEVDWPHATKQQQLNWIGKKTGITITYQVQNQSGENAGDISCFTTRPDTNFGATFVVIAPEHELAQAVAKTSSELANYIEKTLHKTELERQQEGRVKTGVDTGLVAINQLTGRKLPIWVSDFVLAGFGTGAVVGVPGHDKRDFEFAQTFSLPILRVVKAADGDISEITKPEQVQESEGVMINSGFLDGMAISEAIEAMTAHLEKQGWGKRVTTYKLRDWLISRQRYWGAPIPIVYDPDGNPHPVKEEHLPWLLPTDVDFKPTGESPLHSSKEFLERTERLYGKGWKPEFDTMDTFVDSSWYYLRYVSARDEGVFADTNQLQRWLPVDFYMIGPEHIVLHLLYSRFFTKFLRDQGYLKLNEPFLKMRHQGMILGPDNKKMSKSKGNVINPDEIIEKFGADTLRTYEMFMGPIEADKPWDVRAVVGVYRFWQRFYNLVFANLESKESLAKKSSEPTESQLQVLRKLHKVVQKITLDFPELKFNTGIASLMELVNTWEEHDAVVLPLEQVGVVIRLVAPLAPFLAEELYQHYLKVAGTQAAPELWSVHQAEWPMADPLLAKEDFIVLPIQINGKLRATINLAADNTLTEVALVEQALQLPDVQKWTSGKILKRTIYVHNKVLSLVV